MHDPDDDASTIPPSGIPTRPSPSANTGKVSAETLADGRKFGSRYTIIKLLGRGGMGAVYQAWDDELMVSVAIKIILPDVEANESETHAAEVRFKRELLLARQVTHKNVVRIHDLGEVEGRKYITMSFVEGETLAVLLKRTGALQVPQALSFARQIADGLAAAHDVGVVHRDLKPENIMITPGGLALIMDFGIARGTVGTTATRAGTIMGTLEYMAPEQASGKAVDHRADIYAFGLICYDMLLGRQRLKQHEGAMTELLERMMHPPPAPRRLRVDLPEGIDALVMTCIQPAISARYETTAALVEALGRLTPDGKVHVDDDVHLSKRTAFGALVSAVLMLAGLVAGAWYFFNQPAGPARVREPVSVLIATFKNEAGDPLFDGLIEQALGVGIEGASFISNFNRRDAVRDAAQLPGGQLDAQNARLVAIRQGISIVVTGSIAAASPGYRLTVQAIRPGGQERMLFEYTTDAENKEGVLPAVGRIAARVRSGLGDPGVNPNTVRLEETFTAHSLEAAKEYVKGQDQLAAGNYQGAIDFYMKAVAIDPDLGRAYSGAGAAALNAGRRDEADGYMKQAMARLDRMTEREKFRTRGLYYLVGGNAEKAREELEALIKRFPSDSAALTNLSMVHFQRREFDRARDIGRQSAKLSPNAVSRLNNVALFAMYAGDFAGAAQQARKVLEINPGFPKAHLAIAMAHVAGSEYDEAHARFSELATRPAGHTIATQGLADLAMLRGRLEEAASILEQAIGAETSASARGRLMRMLAEVRLAQGRTAEAVKTADRAMSDQPESGTRFAAGSVLIAAGQIPRALAIAKVLSDGLDPESQALGRVLQAEGALAAGEAREALDGLEVARKIADGWLVRFALGRAYLARHAFAEADAEFDACLRRHGEAAAVFLDDVPSYRLVAPVYYYQGIARDGLKSAGARESFTKFLAFKKGGDERSALIDDALRRTKN